MTHKRDADYWQRKYQRRSASYLKRKASRRSEKRVKAIVERPFEGCDGEGVRLADGRCEYQLFRMGSRELFTGRRLTTREILEFILDHPAATSLVGFAFEYDASNILLDLPDDKRTHVLNPPSPAGKGRPWTRLIERGKPPIGVMWLANNYLRVCRLERDLKTGRSRAAKGSTRIIQDCFAFFQCSFIAALKAAGLVDAQALATIERMKPKRSTFTAIDAEIRRYCAYECDQLARLMTDFRDKVLHVEASTGAALRPRTWNGPGKMAASLFRQIGVPRRVEIEAKLPLPLRLLASAAYFGGRFEVSAIGSIDGPVYDNDINAAYPAAAQDLPCLVHGEWREASAGEMQRRMNDRRDFETYVVPTDFRHHDPWQPWCGLPFRAKSPSRLMFPRFGRGVYWSCELRSARLLGARLEADGKGWIYEPAGCSCRPLGRLADLYAARLAMGKDDRGRPLKLVVNSAYGKLAQRIGEAPYHNPVWAGIITAQTRARINEAIALDPAAVVMIATDGILTTRRLSLDEGEALGQWEIKTWQEGAFVVKPGLYWRRGGSAQQRPGDAIFKTRGISRQKFAPAVPRFEEAWRETLDAWARGSKPKAPFVPVTVDQFCSLRLAQARGDLSKACQWSEETRKVTFEFRDKRAPGDIEGDALRLLPLDGDPDAISHVVMSEEERAGYRAGFISDEMLRQAQPDPPEPLAAL